MAEAEIREGFLCPICMRDLGTVSQLQEHFEDAHSSEDKAVLQQLKGLFGKAKQKLKTLARDRDDVDESEGVLSDMQILQQEHVPLGGVDITVWEPQELGATRSHTDYLKQIRDLRIDRFVVETNKLLIRLDKLIGPDVPTDPGKRKYFEKTVVNWAPDSDVKFCVACGKSFNITRRRHHCRLCGGIICNSCSHFLPFGFAKKLTNPSFQDEGDSGFRRSGSNSSLNSMMNPDGEAHLRTCQQCRTLLERRYQQMELRNTKPLIVQLYEKMQSYLEDAERRLPSYLEKAVSLNTGDTNFTLTQAQAERVKLLRQFENIDSLSKRIATLGLNSEETSAPKAVQLQRQIRASISHYLQQNMLGLAPLPSDDELQKLQEARRQEIQQRIAMERQAAVEKEQKRKDDLRKHELQHTRTPSFGGKVTTITTDRIPEDGSTATTSGWKPMQINRSHEEDDPMIQQMNNIRAYIKQAKQAQKLDEVQMLEQNLKELQQVYWQSQQGR